MNIEDVMQEVADRANTIDGLRCFGYPIDGTPPIPAFVVSYPTIEYDRTFGRGQDQLELPCLVVVGRVTDRATRANFAKWFDGAGAESIKAVLESGTYTAFDVIRVARSRDPIVIKLGTVDYLTAELVCDIWGSGS